MVLALFGRKWKRESGGGGEGAARQVSRYPICWKVANVRL